MDIAEGWQLRLQVLYSKFGFTFTELSLQDKEHIVVQESEIIGILPRPGVLL